MSVLKARSSLRALLPVALVGLILAGGAAPADAASRSSEPVKTVKPSRYLVYEQEPGYHQYEFASPSGNLRCRIAHYEDSAPWGCIAVQHAWKDPVLPAWYGGCSTPSERQSGVMLAVYPGSGFIEACKGVFPGLTHRGKTLPMHRRLVVDGISCTSTVIKGVEAMRCVGPRKASFTMSKRALTFHQPKGWKG